jgi:nicotinate-nucleotide adenylyltransferase
VRIGIYGGSFDPVHIGHLLVAESCREAARLDRVDFLPAAVPPHKQSRGLAAPEHRLAMLELAIGGNPGFGILEDELARGGVSWTVDTLAALAAARPGDALHLILGPDALAELPTWRDPERILGLATPLAVEREGLDDVAAVVAAPALHALLGGEGARRVIETRVRCPVVGIRSTELRRRVAAGRSIRYLTPAAVERYIAAHRLYESPG